MNRYQTLSTLGDGTYGSVIKAILTNFPEYNWEIWKFHQVPKRYWEDLLHQRECFDRLAQQFQVHQPSDWYSLSYADVAQVASGVLGHFNNSLIKALQTVYPEYIWYEWRFNQVPKGFWNDINNLRDYINWLSDQLDIKEFQDWYSVTIPQLLSLRAYSPINKYGGLIPVLKMCFPDQVWNPNAAILYKVQNLLYKMARKLFSNLLVEMNYKHPELRFSKSNSRMEFDVFIPSLNVALEYQGQQHYNFHFMYGSEKCTQQRDTEKKDACQKIGITLIEIPYWWDRQLPSLMAAINKARPDLISVTE